MWRSLEKQDRGAKQREQSTPFKVLNFRTVESNMRKFISRCEIPKAKFRTPLFKVRKFLHRAKHPPGTRVAFRTAQANFRTVRIKVQKFRTPQSKVRNSFQHAKITVQGANSLNVSFAHHYSRCENFRTVRNKVRKFRTV